MYEWYRYMKLAIAGWPPGSSRKRKEKEFSLFFIFTFDIDVYLQPNIFGQNLLYTSIHTVGQLQQQASRMVQTRTYVYKQLVFRAKLKRMPLYNTLMVKTKLPFHLSLWYENHVVMGMYKVFVIQNLYSFEILIPCTM